MLNPLAVITWASTKIGVQSALAQLGDFVGNWLQVTEKEIEACVAEVKFDILLHHISVTFVGERVQRGGRDLWACYRVQIINHWEVYDSVRD